MLCVVRRTPRRCISSQSNIAFLGSLGPRFPPMSNAYDENLVDIVYKSAQKLSFDTFVRKGGTYCFVSGPMYESQSEARFLRGVGGDAVGMR